jgi:hypothetical protein
MATREVTVAMETEVHKRSLTAGDLLADVSIIELSNENKMSDGGRGRGSLGMVVWKSSQKWSVQPRKRSGFAPSPG